MAKRNCNRVKTIISVTTGFFCVIFFLLSIGCRQPVRINGRTLADSIAILTRNYDFRPLDSAEVYAFLNKYYLPRLDTMRTKRQIFIYPLNGIDFNERFQSAKKELTARYAGDTASNNRLKPPPPPSTATNKSFVFDSKRLLNTRIVSDTSANAKEDRANYPSTEAWHKRFGYGYMCISYPQYNANTKRLVLREWLENYFFCGTGRERTFYFTKTATGWQSY